MSWFDQGNKISESDLIAFHLHELPPRREREVARALERSASLTAVSASVEGTLRAVKDAPRPIDQAAFTRTWAALQPQLKPYAMPLPAKPYWQTPVFGKAALASLSALGVGVGVMMVRMYKPSSHVPVAATLPAVESVTASNTPLETEKVPSLASAGTFHDRLSTSFIHSRPKQAEAPPTPLLTPYPTSSTPWTATSEPPPQEPDALSASLLTPPAHPETPAENTSQTPVTTAAKKGKSKPHGLGLPLASYRTDVMLALGGTFVGSHSSLTAKTEPRTLSVTKAVTAIGSFHQQFRPALGYRVTVSYTRPDFQYTYASSPGSGGFSYAGDVNSRIFEAAGTYVVQGPHHGRWSTSADAGGGLMAFLPAASYAYRAVGILGASADYAISRHWAARASYRAQIFRTPAFRDAIGTIPITASLVLSHEPSVGIVYRFGKTEPRTPKP